MINLQFKYSLLLCIFFCTICHVSLGNPKPERPLPEINIPDNDTTKLKLLLQRSFLLVNKKGEDEKDLSEAVRLAQQALLLASAGNLILDKVAAYTVLSQCFREKKNEPAGRQFADMAIRNLPNGSGSLQAANAFVEYSNYLDPADAKSLEQKITYYTKAVGIFRKLEPGTKKFADALKFLGDLKNSRYETAEAIALLKESLALYKKLGVKELQDIYDLLGDALTSSGNTVEGLDYQLKALQLAERCRDTTQMLSTIYYRLAFTYNAINQDVKTAEYMEKARHSASINHNVNDWIMISANLGTIYNKLGKYRLAVRTCKEALSKCADNDYQSRAALITNLLYAAVVTKDLKSAAPLYQELAGITDNHKVEINTTDAAMIEYLIAIKRFDDARFRIDKMIDLTKVTQSLISKQKIEHYQFQVDSAMGDFISAIGHLNRSQKFRDSLLSRNYNKQIGRMQLTFDLQKKDQDLAFKSKHIALLTRQNDLQKKTLKNEQLVRNLFIASVILLILLLFLGYNRYKIKQQANFELHEQKEEINAQNESLQQLLDEREWLLKEVHHRVKNNLQIVISLLNSQLANIEDIAALDVIRESQNRMRSISLIHQKLYQFDNQATIDAGDYVREVAYYLQDSFDTFGSIRFTITADPVMMDVSQAVPVGLILNEAITNSIKYAFSGQSDSHISVRLKIDAEKNVTLLIADNGKGLPPEFDLKKCRSMGMQLMNGLSKQIRSEFDLVNDNGLKITLKWQQIDMLVARRKRTLENRITV